MGSQLYIPEAEELAGWALHGRSLQAIPYSPTLEIVGYFDAHNGYGNETISLAKALAPMLPVIQARKAIAPLPPEVAIMLARDRSSVTDAVWPSPPFDLPGNYKDPVRRHVITMWETDTVPEEWAVYFKDVANVFCPCPASVEAFQKLLPDKPVHLLTSGIESDFWGPPVERDWSGKLKFGMIGSLTPRKYALETFRAFRAAFGDRDDVHLDMVDGVGGLHPAMFKDVDNVTYRRGGGIPPTALRDWYRSKHVLLFPSRGEGHGRPPLEMACTGGAVVATKGMGMYWLSSDVGFPISWEWTQVKGFPWFYGAKWMEPNFEDLVETLRYIDKHRGEARERAGALASAVPFMYDWNSTANRLLNLIG